MKKWLACLMALSLILAACGDFGDDDSNKKESSSSKTEQSKSKDDSKSKESKDKAPSKEENQNHATSNDSNANGNNEATNNTQSSQNNQDKNNTGQNQSNSNISNQESSHNSSTYVAPYHGQNVAPVAQNLAQHPVNQQQALKQLPNFQMSLDAAKKEVMALNGQQNPYNDYAIQGEGGKYHYIFSFLNQSQPGTYMIVTVDQSGTPRIIDPAYHQ